MSDEVPFPHDRHRPRYHFLPPAKWMNDPNGLMQLEGRYHLFYQHNPNGAFWGTMHWGHAVSTDLVHWEHLPIALAPDPGGPDADGCFSGCAVIHEGLPTLFYTGVRGENQLACLATSTDPDLRTWMRFAGNPVIPAPPAGLETTIFRDHAVWRENDAWYQIIGSGIRGVGGAALLYRSDDLVTWEYLHPFCVETPEMAHSDRPTLGWECPDTFALDGGQVLIVCFWDGEPISVTWFTGAVVDERFVPRRQGIVDAGSCFYAPQSFTDARGRRIMFGWLREARSAEAQVAAGWSGAMSLPRVLSIRENGELATAPAPEVQALRGEHVCIEAEDVVPGEDLCLEGIAGDACEVVATFGCDAGEVGLDIRRAPDGTEVTSIRVAPAAGSLTLDTRRARTDRAAVGEVASMPVSLDPVEDVRLRVFVDRSVVEVFLNDRVSISGRVYPAREDSLGIRVVAPGREALAGPVEAWAMRGA